MLEETEELLVAVPVLAEPGHLPGGDFQGGEQGGGAMADVVVAALLVVARLHHKHFLGAVQRLDLTRPSSTHNTIALAGGFRYRPTTSVTLASSSGSVENLNVSAFHGRIPVLLPGLGDRGLGTPPGGQPAADSTSESPPDASGEGLGVAVMIAASSTTFDQPGRGMSTSPSRPCSR